MSPIISLALPKGRMQAGVLQLMREAGLEVVFAGERDLRPTIPSMPAWRVKMLKPRNAVELLHTGSRDVCFGGSDLIAERFATCDESGEITGDQRLGMQ